MAGGLAGIPRSQPMRILVIEDNRDIAANLGDYLENAGTPSTSPPT